jgi:hypothetical protein
MSKLLFMSKIIGLFICVIASGQLHAQVSVNNDGSSPHSSAMLEIKSNSKGLLPPRMTWSQIQAIANPAEGLTVYDTGIKSLRMFNGKEWVVLGVKEYELTDPPGNFSTMAVASGSGTASGYEVLISPDKKIYVAGTYIGSITIGNVILDPPVGTNNIFFAAFDSVSALIWLKVISGSMEHKVEDMEFDQAGNIILAGSFSGSIDLDPGSGNDTHVSTAGDDIFFAKYNTSGDLIWGRHMGGTNNDIAKAIVADPSGNIYLTGTFFGTADFDPGPGTAILSATGSTHFDMFLARYDGLGNWVWSHKLGSTSFENVADIEWLAGTILLGGNFNGTMDFDPSAGGAFNMSASGTYDVFFARYDITGGFLWAKKIGGTGHDEAVDFCVDGLGNFWVLGTFAGTADMDPDAGTTNLVSGGGDNTFFAKYQSSGALLVAQGMGCTGPTDMPVRIVLDLTGNVFICGSFVGSGTQMDFDPGFDIVSLVSQGPYADWYMAKYTVDGNFVWVDAMGGAVHDYCYAFAVAPDGEFIIATGKLQSTMYKTFSGERLTNSSQFYLARYEE